MTDHTVETSPPAASAVQNEPDRPVLTIEERRERERHAWIAEHAYYLTLARGFAPGGELDDWLAAERELDTGRVASAS